MKQFVNRLITFVLAIALIAGLIDVNSVKAQAAENTGVSMNIKWDYGETRYKEGATETRYDPQLTHRWADGVDSSIR